MIIVFGSLNVDMVMNVESMPKPGETVLCPGYNLYAGGKGANQAVAAARAGSKTKIYGAIGQDGFGQIAISELISSGVDCSGLSKVDAPTGCASICVDAGGENQIAVASGANLFAEASSVPEAELNSDAIVLLQMEIDLEENWEMVKKARQSGAKVILNLAPAKHIPVEILPLLSILIVNKMEAQTLALHLGFGSVSATMAARRIAATFDITCVVTLGGNGAFVCNKDACHEVDALGIKPVDTTAAGDCFAGVFAASLDQGHDMYDALRYASTAAGLACLKAGAQPSLPYKDAIAKAVGQIKTPRRAS